MISIVYFGSFQKFSVKVLEKLRTTFQISGVITTPPAPKGRHLELVKNETQIYSETNNIPCFPLDTLDDIPAILTGSRPDFIVVAGYGKLIPNHWLNLPKISPINMHPSLLPDYAGRCPAEWALLNGDRTTGVTLIQMTSKFDAGPILAQQSLDIKEADNRLTLYEKLYDLGANLLLEALPKIAENLIIPSPQVKTEKTSAYARQITREDGFIPYDEFVTELKNSKRSEVPQSGIKIKIETKLKAFWGWPGVWTTDKQDQRIKLVSLKPEVIVQYEGKNPLRWKP